MAKASASDVKAGGAHVEIGGETSKLDGVLSMAKKKLKAFGGNVTKLGKSFSKLGAVMAIPLAGGVKMAADFGEQMAFVSTMLDQSDLSKFMPNFRAEIRKMSVDFGEGTDTISRGLYDILSASIAPARALDVLRASMLSAKAGMTDTGTAADAITTILNSYKLGADQALSVSDLLFATVKRGKTTFDQLAPAVGMVAATASVAGLSMEEMAATLATGTRNGVRTRIAVTALNSTLMAFLKPTTKAEKAAKKFGFELKTNTLRTIGLAGVIKKMQGATAEQIASVFENRRALKLIMPVMQDLEGFTIDLALAQKRAGLTMEAYGKTTTTLMHAMHRLKQSIADLLRALGISLEKRAEAWTEAIIGVINAIKLWIKQNPELVTSYANLAIRLVAIGASLMVVGKGITFISNLLSPGGIFAIGLGSILYFSGLLDDNTKKWLDWVGEIELGSATVGGVFEKMKRLWRDLKPEWESGMSIVKSTWDWFMAGLRVGWLKMSRAILNGVIQMFSELANVFRAEAEKLSPEKIGLKKWAMEGPAETFKRWKFAGVARQLRGMGTIMTEGATAAGKAYSGLADKIINAENALEAAANNRRKAMKGFEGSAESAKEKIGAVMGEIAQSVSTPPEARKGPSNLIKSIMEKYPQVQKDAEEVAKRAERRAYADAVRQGKTMKEVVETSSAAYTKGYDDWLNKVEEGWIASTARLRGAGESFAKAAGEEEAPGGGRALGAAATGIVGTFAGATASLLAGGPRRVLEDQLDTMKKILNASERTADNTAERGLA